MKNNRFIVSAMEELAQDDVVRQDVSDVKIITKSETAVTAANTDGEVAPTAVAETNVDNETDAVAVLMEQNSQLKEENASLESDNFDNDVTQIETTSDSVNEDLEEIVNSVASLEELAHIANLTANSGQANSACLASLAFALEQLTDRLGLEINCPAMEAEGSDMTAGQKAKAIGESAIEQSKKLIKRLVEGIKRLIGWMAGLIRGLTAPMQQLEKRAKRAAGLVDSIDEGKMIDSTTFITSLRLVKGQGDANEQFAAFQKVVPYALRWLFSDALITQLEGALTVGPGMVATSEKGVNVASTQLQGIVDYARKTIFTEGADGSEVPVDGNHLDITLTKPFISGVQGFLATNKDGAKWFARAGLVTSEIKLDKPDTIPTVNKKLAKAFLDDIQVMMQFKEYDSALKRLESLGNKASKVMKEFPNDDPSRTHLYTVVSQYLSTTALLATSIIPLFSRTNMFVSASFIKYVEESAKASKVEK